jgi:hypothetical protein
LVVTEDEYLADEDFEDQDAHECSSDCEHCARFRECYAEHREGTLPEPRPDQVVRLDPDGVYLGDEFLRSTSFADLDRLVDDTVWTWPGWVPESYITAVSGDHGAGKTWLALALVRSITHGVKWPDGHPGPDKPGTVLWVESEQRQSVVRRRLRALGIDERRVKTMPDPFRTYHLDRDRDFLRIAAVAKYHQPRLMVVDAWSRALAGREGDSCVRHTLDRLQHLARDLRMPVLLLPHVRKPQASDWSKGFDFDRLRGSSALAQVAVSIIGVDALDRGSEHRRVSAGKATLAPLPPPLGFRIEGRADLGEHCRLVFGPPPRMHARLSRLEEAQDFLRHALAHGPRPAGELKREATAAGVAAGTLRLARERVCVPERERGRKGRWLWALRPATSEQPHTQDTQH